MKKRHEGPILRLNRMTYGDTLEYISMKSGISISRLSEFENRKIRLSEEDLWKVYKVIGLDYQRSEIVETYMENKFIDMYQKIVYMEEFEVCYLDLKQYLSKIQLSLCYPKYLLMELLYHYYSRLEFDYLSRFKLLSEHMDYLEEYQIQIFYDCQGIYYKNHDDPLKALVYFEKAEKINVMDMVSSMVYYHKAQPLNYLGKTYESVKYIKKANNLFVKSLNLKRMLLASLTLATCYDVLGDYDESKRLYVQCIEHLKQMHWCCVLNVAYNNLMWSCILSKNYTSVLKYGKEALKEDDSQATIYFYLSYACCKMGRVSDAKRYIRLAKNLYDNESDYFRAVIDAFYTLLSDQKKVELKERKLLKAYKEAKKCEDNLVILFVLDMLIEHYESQKDLSNMVLCLKEQVEIYRKHK